jgi:uncharacterized membrane protein YphA (DoxX/SURF4 family)
MILLRIAVGWHFLYEGVWKVESDKGNAYYSATWYTLQSSVGRLEDYFEQNETEGVKLGPALARVDAWYDEIVKGFKGRSQPLAEDQKARLAEVRDQVRLAAVEAARGTLPAGDVVLFDWIFIRDTVLRVPPAKESERFSSLPYLQQSSGPLRPLFRGLVRDMDGLERLSVPAAQAAIDQRCEDILGHYSSAGLAFSKEQQARLLQARDTLKASIAATMKDESVRARIQDYRALRQRVAGDGTRRNAPFTEERLAEDRRKLDEIAGELLATVNEPLAELAAQAQNIASVDQFQAGPVPRPGDPAGWIDRLMKWGLIVIGACLLVGLFTPVAALAAAGQLAVFYLASPPWPGLPAASLGGHYLFVDRNLIELVGALVIAGSGSGRWAGLDAYVRRPKRAAVAPAVLPPVEEQELVRTGGLS